MRRNIKKTIILVSAISIMSTGICMASGKVGNSKEQAYMGVIKGSKTNTTLDFAYRDTAKKSDPFYVQLNNSSEGSGTVTTFWLEDSKENNLCEVVNVTQGKGFYPQNTYQSACKKTVYLTAENNNYNSTIYRIEGSWKEE